MRTDQKFVPATNVLYMGLKTARVLLKHVQVAEFQTTALS